MSNKAVINTEKAPAAIGPYSQAVVVGEWVFVSGQIPIDPGTGELIDGGIGHFPLRPLELQIGQPMPDGDLLPGIVHEWQKCLVAVHYRLD